MANPTKKIDSAIVQSGWPRRNATEPWQPGPRYRPVRMEIPRLPRSGVPVGATIFVDLAIDAAQPVAVSDSRGNVYAAEIDEVNSKLFRGFVNTALEPGDLITITFVGQVETGSAPVAGQVETAAMNAYYVMGLADAPAVATASGLDTVGPVADPGVILASRHFYDTVGPSQAPAGNVGEFESFMYSRADRSSHGISRSVLSSYFDRRATGLNPGPYTFSPWRSSGGRLLWIASFAAA